MTTITDYIEYTTARHELLTTRIEYLKRAINIAVINLKIHESDEMVANQLKETLKYIKESENNDV